MKLVTNKFKSGGLREKHVVATWNLGNHLSICLQTQKNQEKPVSRWSVAGPSEYWLLASSLASKEKQQYTHRITNTHKMTTIPTRQLQQYTQDNKQQYTQHILKYNMLKSWTTRRQESKHIAVHLLVCYINIIMAASCFPQSLKDTLCTMTNFPRYFSVWGGPRLHSG